ncbi:MAG: hypothetical protein DRP11_01930 [Candidatus Aenigmatarchaeota archaeon]|nr:MAG: hypothetical protein DRP11_01930 [Candidatus Aenigmarchaeota archaeon]
MTYTVVGVTAKISMDAGLDMLEALKNAIDNADSPKVDLIDEAGNVVKSLDPSVVSVAGEDSYARILIEIEDNSTDVYTFKKVKVRGKRDTYTYTAIIFELDNPISKSDTDILDLILKWGFPNTVSG